jgi:hypothetical protein
MARAVNADAELIVSLALNSVAGCAFAVDSDSLLGIALSLDSVADAADSSSDSDSAHRTVGCS